MKLFALLLAGSYAQYDQVTDDGTVPIGDSYDQYGGADDYYGGYDAGYGDAYGDSYGPGADDNRKNGNRNKNKGNKNQAPAGNYQAPVDNYQAPVASYQAPAATYQEPAASYQAPADNYQAPAGSYQAPAYQGMTCWSCHASSYEECGKNGYEQRCNPGDVCYLEVRERRDGRYFSQIAMGCLQDMACENNKMQNFNQPNVDHTQCKPETKYRESVCRQCCAESNCTKDPSWWQPATREEWAYPDSPYPTQAPAYQEPAYQGAPADNYQAPAANYQAPADNYQAPPAAQESYTAPAYKK